jgi:hypothetical protein
MAMEFEQLPRESNKAFAAFRVYLDLGPERSLATTGAKLGKSKVMMEKWSRRYNWSGRVAAHARYVTEVERLAIEGLAREKAVVWDKVWEDQRILEWNRRNRLVRLADRLLEEWEKHPEKRGTLEGLARIMELGVRLGRQASGMPLETKEIKGEIKATLEVEWEIALKKIYGRGASETREINEKVIDVESKEAAVRSQMANQSLLTSAPTGNNKEKGK